MISRIAMLSYHTCPLASEEGKESGGMNVYVLELSKRLARCGMAVDIFTRCADPSNEHIVQIEPRLRLMHIFGGPASNIAKKDLPDHIPDFVQNIKLFIAEQKISFDMVHAHYYMSGLAGLALRDVLPNTPLVMTFHTLALMKNLVARTSGEMESEVRIRAEFKLVALADRIIAPSESDREYLHYLYDAAYDKIVTIPPGVDTDLFRPIEKRQAKRVIGANPEECLVLFAGRIEPLKGIDSLLYAIKILRTKRENKNIRLWIVGGDISDPQNNWSDELRKLDEISEVLGIETQIKFVGQKPQRELPYYYNAAEVVVMPSHYESFGMAAAEAMACGAPVITTNVTGVSGILDERHRTLVVSAQNPILLSDAIEKVLRSPMAYSDLSAKIRERTRDLDWEQIAQRMARVYYHTKCNC